MADWFLEGFSLLGLLVSDGLEPPLSSLLLLPSLLPSLLPESSFCASGFEPGLE